MITFLIHFEKSNDALRFISSVSEYDIITEYSVMDSGKLLTLSLICKCYSDCLSLVQTVENLLVKLAIDVRPYSISYSELLN